MSQLIRTFKLRFAFTDIVRRAAWLAGALVCTAPTAVRNEVRLHAQVHRWFAHNGEPYAWVQLKRRVYEELFLSSPDDPWLGLGPREVFSVLAPAEGGRDQREIVHRAEASTRLK